MGTKQLPAAKPKVTQRGQLVSWTKEESVELINLSQLQPSEREVALASLEKKIREYTSDEMTVFLVGLITRTHMNCGYNFDRNFVDQYLDSFVHELKCEEGNLSLQELEITFRNGYKGVYGKFTGLNKKTYFDWINGYKTSEKKRLAAQLLKDRVLPEKKLSEGEIEQILKQGCLNAFERYKSTGFTEDIANVSYKYLVKIGVINYTKVRRNKFKKQAQEKLLAESKIRHAEQKNEFDRKAVAEYIREIESNIEHSTIVTEAKKIALNTFFKELQEMELELKDRM